MRKARCGRLLVACVLLASTSGVAASADDGTGLVVGPTIRAPFLDDHFADGIAILDDGAFALFGTTTILTDNQGFYLRFEVQLYSRTGDLLRSFVPKPAASTGGVGSLGERYFVSWQYFAENKTRASFLDEQGALLEKQRNWPNSPIDFYSNYYRYGAGPTFRLLPIVFYVDGQFDGEPNFQVIVQVYGPDGVAFGPPLSLAPPSDWTFFQDAAINGMGRVVVLYQLCRPLFTACVSALQVFRDVGVPESGILTDDTPSFNTVVGIEDGGNFLLEWNTPTLVNNGAPLFVRLFDPHGLPLSPTLPVSEGPAVPLVVRGLANGDFVFSWDTQAEDGRLSFYACYFDSSAKRFLEPVLIVRDYLSADGFHFEMNHLGEGILAWTTLAANGVFTGHYKRLMARGKRTAPTD
jgi:hypothetical protein